MKSYIKYSFMFVIIALLIKLTFFQDTSFHLMESIKYLLVPLIDAYLSAFQDPNTSLLLFLAIVLLCLVSLYWIYFEKYIPLRKKIDNSIEAAEEAQSVIYSKKVSASEGLVGVENDEFLKPLILKFKNSFLFNKKDGGAAEFDYFNLNILETKGFPLKIISALPGYFVGIGLIFTFLGLVAALYFSAQGMKAGNYADAKASMMHLLYASSFKFTTSIAGVSASLVISVLYKALLHKLHLKLCKLEEVMESIFYAFRTNNNELS
ncbi:MAG: hypothetical protein JSR85_00375 [Proteobacteria bacterium]|nr:hypothetical protein [Pseudomonadota bacterium]